MARAATADTGPLVAYFDRAERNHAWAAERVRALHRKYRDRPISLADACIVRMAELFEEHSVLTLDSDFSVYRKHGRQPLDLIHP